MINELLDAESDRFHPTKHPASGGGRSRERAAGLRAMAGAGRGWVRSRPDGLVSVRHRPRRKPFRYYTEQRLLLATVVYGVGTLCLFGVFAVRYRLELLLALPLVVLVMAIYLSLGFKRDSPVQRPEELYRQPILVMALVLCALAIVCFLFVDVPFLHTFLRTNT